MLRISRYTHALLLLCIASTIICVALVTYSNLLPDVLFVDVSSRSTSYPEVTVDEVPMTFPRKRNFTDEQIEKMSILGKWLLISDPDLPPPVVNNRTRPYLILIWKHGAFLERRHIKRFSDKKFSPWDHCTVDNCILSYRDEDIDKADAVVFHLHLTKSTTDLPQRQHTNQRWIFLTDESPLHTFLNGQSKLAGYNNLFNWSMSYRSDSDVPVPYGRTVIRRDGGGRDESIWRNHSNKILKTKLIAVMGSNCVGANGRWNYVKELKTILGSDLDIFGKCLKGNVTACPGHFRKDCDLLKYYKFYLAFENSNCKEYLTEKVFWNGYEKGAVPIIMGASKEDCERLLPPRSFLHISDFANPFALANYIQYLHQYPDKYAELQAWRKYYRVINEHGYFGSASRHYCRICEALHYNEPTAKTYENLASFFNKEQDCAIV